MAFVKQGVLPGARMKTTPVPVQKSVRRLDCRSLTSMPAGKVVPIYAFPLLREDRLSMSRFRLNFEMMETAELLMNPVNVSVRAYLVPNLAFDRFNGIDQLNRSYMKQPETDGGVVTPFFQTMAFARATNEIMTRLGLHAREGQLINTAYVEAYNQIWNYRVANRSPDIAKRALSDVTLAKAFWLHTQFAHIVPDFDQATIDGEVPLNVTSQALRLTGLGIAGNNTSAPIAGAAVRETQHPGVNAGTVTYPNSLKIGPTMNATDAQFYVRMASNIPSSYPQVFAEMAEMGITVSLSNIELARKTQAFAALRRQYTGHTDDYIIDLLMSGVTVPEQAWRQPILLGQKDTIFGMAKRYASDSVDLTASVVNGGTFVDLAITTPTCPTGGVVMITAEVTPEQIFERQQDPYVFISDTEMLPEFLRDTLDPEKVEVVENQYIDVDHATPTATFGYAPLNHKWNHAGAHIGGKFYRPEVDAAFDEDRQRIWAVETANPTLSEDFYLCSNMHTKIFVVTDQDPFEAVLRGIAAIQGNTVFGALLLEASDDYAEILGEAPLDRIDKPASAEMNALPVEGSVK